MAHPGRSASAEPDPPAGRPVSSGGAPPPAARPPGAARRTRRTSGRLPWWALVLPGAAFAVLLALAAGPAQAGPSGTRPLAHVLGGLGDLLLRLLSYLS